MSKKKKVLLSIISVIVVLLTFGAGFLTSRLTQQKELNDLNYILEMYRRYYYDEQEDVVGIFADSLLDRYSEYYTKEQYELIKKADGGSREGIGVTFSGLTIASVKGNSPAERAGIKSGGVIKAIKTNGDFTYLSSLSEFSSALSEIDAYTDFTLLVDYDGEEKQFVLQKKEYLQTFVHYSDDSGEYGFSDADGSVKFVRLGDSDLSGDTAYIDLDSFSGSASGLAGTIGQFETAMKTYKEHGKKNLIIDLRDNGGGFMFILQDVVRYFLDVKDGERPLVCVAKDKYGNRTELNSESVRYGEYTFDNIVILANVSTASASEAFIGAVLDYDAQGKVKVILEKYSAYGNAYYRTYGKGIMQTTFERLGGGAIKLTTSKLFWPTSDVCIHDVGVTTGLNDRFANKIIEESPSGAYYDALSICA